MRAEVRHLRHGDSREAAPAVALDDITVSDLELFDSVCELTVPGEVIRAQELSAFGADAKQAAACLKFLEASGCAYIGNFGRNKGWHVIASQGPIASCTDKNLQRQRALTKLLTDSGGFINATALLKAEADRPGDEAGTPEGSSQP